MRNALPSPDAPGTLSAAIAPPIAALSPAQTPTLLTRFGLPPQHRHALRLLSHAVLEHARKMCQISCGGRSLLRRRARIQHQVLIAPGLPRVAQFRGADPAAGME
jgi:hypothetical protein